MHKPIPTEWQLRKEQVLHFLVAQTSFKYYCLFKKKVTFLFSSTYIETWQVVGNIVKTRIL